MKSLLLHFLIYIFFCITSPMFAQQDQLSPVTTNVLKLNFFLPGISYEQKLAELTTLHLDAYIDGLIITSAYSADEQSHVYPTPSFKAEVRTYYNLLKRNFKGTRTAMNSANYFAPLYVGRYTLVSEYEERKWINQLGVVWGIQRNGPGRFSIDVNTGLVYTVNAKSYYFYDPINIVLHLRLGFWLGRKSKYD
jgi:hypothetical protein